jgi:hypothetical protein
MPGPHKHLRAGQENGNGKGLERRTGIEIEEKKGKVIREKDRN